MVRYKLSELANKRRGTAVTLAPISGSLSAECDYLKALRVLLREVAKATREDILPAIERELAQKRSDIVADADPRLFERLAGIVAQLSFAVQRMVDRILDLEAKRHSEKFMAAAKRALGVDLAAVVRQEDLAGLLRDAAIKNAGLIKGMADDTVKRISTAVMNALLNGVPVRQLRSKLTEDFRIADRRAQLIARNEIASLNADLNRFRHEQAGVTTYTWRTAADERVRPLHRSLDGKVYQYGKPTGAEDGLPPGKPVNCRCVGIGIVQF